MKIAYLSRSVIPSRSANSVQVIKMCNALARENHEIALFHIDAGHGSGECLPVKLNRNIELLSFNRPPMRYFGQLVYAHRVKKTMDKRDPVDLIFGRDPVSLLLTNQSPVIYETHAPPSSQIGYEVEKRLFRKPNFRLLIAISNALRLRYIELFPQLNKSNILVAPDGADIVPHDQTFNKNIGKRTKVGYTGHLYPGKGMEVISRLAEKMPSVEFHVIGGNSNDLKLWRKKCSYTNLFFHGYVPHDDLAERVKCFDIMIAPYLNKVSVWGGKGDVSKWMSPLKIFEYMSLNKPIVASKLPVIEEVLEDGHNAVLVDPANIHEWVQAIEYLMMSPNFARRLAEAAYSDLVGKYSWEIRTNRILKRVGERMDN